MRKCTGDAMIGRQCPNDATWENGYGVRVCNHHKLLLDAFTWEGRNDRIWTEIPTIGLENMTKEDGHRIIKEILAEAETIQS